MTGSWKGRGNQYIEFAGVVYCKLPTNGKQLPAFPLEPIRGSIPGLRGGRRECYNSATVAPRWWLDPNKVLKGQPLHPLRHTLQLFTDASNEGWGSHLEERMARGLWSEPEGKLHINLLELKAILLVLKQFQHLCWNQTILVYTDNTTVVSYIIKEGRMRSGSLCALLWRLLMWCNRREIVLWARHIHCRQTVQT